ncbi:alpha/beta fold hydrolase [Kibdelosporangium aridum]|uniref:Alpha/beta hydrolase family protein n=1 Tax=Kibdelosporangium aridum TaxID=2030 RepID=A0A1Y5XYL2_KIBAR|nr:alpha/beta hydrolase [Kibdelosporangium aridum]SMD21084.1 Alpha/beta hydrolase family protein [Kibdelosporangium aridum]
MGTAVSADGTKIAYEREGTGPAVILVDAAGGYRDFNSLRPLADLIAKEGFTTYTYDRRGRGLSTDNQPYAVEREIEDLAAVIDAAGGQASVYGWSSGALLVMRAAASGLPITRLAVFEPPYGGSDEHDDEVREQLEALVAEGKRGAAVDLFHQVIGVPEEIMAQMDPIKPMLEKIAHTYPYDWTIAGTTSPEHITAVPTPTLVLDSTATGKDMHDGVEQVAKLIPNAVHKRLEGEWHGVPNEVLAPELASFYKG